MSKKRYQDRNPRNTEVENSVLNIVEPNELIEAEVVAEQFEEVGVPEPVVERKAIVPKVGYVSGCKTLNVRAQSNLFASILCTIAEGAKVSINESKSTDVFYKVCTAAGVEGFCMKKFITIK